LIPSADKPQMSVVRLLRPDAALLSLLEGYDCEAFGSVALRSYDLAVMAEAGAIYLARVQDEIVGSCQLLRVFDEPSFCYVVGFYIRTPWRGNGLGRAFLEELAAKCRGMGAEGMMLTVSPTNEAAMGLYRGAGFVEEAFVPHFYGEGEDRYILRWRFETGDLPGGV